jgi:hypothetical protein
MATTVEPLYSQGSVLSQNDTGAYLIYNEFITSQVLYKKGEALLEIELRLYLITIEIKKSL